MAAGADVIKTSSGREDARRDRPVTLVMLEATRDFERATGRVPGRPRLTRASPDPGLA